MGLTIDANVLKGEVAALQRVVTRKSLMPALNSIRIEPVDTGVRLTATDLEVTLTSEIDIQMTGDPMLVPGARLHDMVKLLDGPVSIESQGGRVKVSGGRFTSRLQAFNESDYPDIPVVEHADAHDMPASMMATMIALTKCCVCEQDTGYVLSGSLFSVDAGQATMVSTDGKRLALVATPFGGAFGAEVISGTALRELIQLTSSSGDDDVRYASSETHLWFACGRRTITATKLAGEFPKYQKVIPSSHEIRVEIDRASFHRAVQRAMLVASVGNDMVNVSLSSGTMRIDATTAGVGDAADEIEVAYSGDDFVFGVDGSFLDDFLRAVDTTDVVMELTDPSKQIVLMPGVPSDPEEPMMDYKYVCMPMQLA